MGSGSEGVDDLCFQIYGKISPPPPSSSSSPPSLSPPSNPSLGAQILVLRPKSQFQGPNPSLEAQILSSRLKSHPKGWDLGLIGGIWVSKVGLSVEDRLTDQWTYQKINLAGYTVACVQLNQVGGIA